MNQNWAAATAHRIGLAGELQFVRTRVGQTLHIPCSRGHIVDFKIAGNMPPDFVAKKMMQKGWTIGSKLTCPKHSQRSSIKKEEAMPNDPTPIAPVLTPAAASPDAKPSVAAGKAKRLVYMALEDYYDEAAKRYKPDHSDATIAKSCGIAEALVKTIREESYGPLGEPSDLTEFREVLKAARKAIADNGDELRQKIRTLELRLDAIVRKHGWIE